MNLKKHILTLASLLLLTQFSFAQIDEVTRAKYFVKHEGVGKIDRKFVKELKKMDLEHPSGYFEISLNQAKKGNLNESAVATYLGLMKYVVYNQTNPEYDETADGAVFSALLAASFQEIGDYLNSNLTNYAFVLKKALSIQNRDNKYYFDKEASKAASKQIMTSLQNLQKELKSTPETYISTLEKASHYTENEALEDSAIEDEDISTTLMNEKPDLSLFLGKTVSGKTLDGNNKLISCDEIKNFKLEEYQSPYAIESWEMTMNDSKFTGLGNELSDAAVEMINQGHKDDIILIVAQVIDTNGEIFSLKGVFLK